MNEQAKSFRILTEAVTGSDSPADNLLCLSNMLSYIQTSIIYSSEYCFSKENSNGLSCVLSIIEHDLRALSEVTELKIEEQFRRKSEIKSEK